MKVITFTPLSRQAFTNYSQAFVIVKASKRTLILSTKTFWIGGANDWHFVKEKETEGIRGESERRQELPNTINDVKK